MTILMTMLMSLSSPAAAGPVGMVGTAATGAISGRVTAASGGGALPGVFVEVFDERGSLSGYVTTGSDGRYTAAGLPVSTYAVCFSAYDTVAADAGYLDRCYQHSRFDGSPPTQTTRVRVRSGSTSVINVALTSAAGISGTVTARAGGNALGGVNVQVFDLAGNYVGSGATASDGTYAVRRLAASGAGYRVCFDPLYATGGSSSAGYSGQCYRDVPWDGGYVPPAGATPVPAVAGTITKGINATLVANGKVSGIVTARVGGGPLSGVLVKVFDRAGKYLTAVTTAPNGTYLINGLIASATKYTVCFDARYAAGGSSVAGYASQCYQNVAWDLGDRPPAGAVPVPVPVGATTSGINAALSAQGGIAGRVTAASGGVGVSGVDIRVFDRTGSYVAAATTTPNGTYAVKGLRPSSSGYTVCFDASHAAGGSSRTGYLSQCYNNRLWDGGFTPPPGRIAVPVSAGTVAVVDAALTPAGGIAGTVTTAIGAQALAGVEVKVFGRAGEYLATASTGATGTYAVNSLVASDTGYTVCFDANSATGGPFATGYASQCYHDVAWTGGFVAPAGTTAVPVALGASTPGISASLTARAWISGTVTASGPAGGKGLAGVFVNVYDGSGRFVKSGSTQSNGTYTVGGLASSKTGYLVCFDASNVTGEPSRNGYGSRCYKNVPWNGVSAPPAGTTAVPVPATSPAVGVNAVLVPLAGISGTVTAASGGGPLGGVLVDVFNRGGKYLTTVATDDFTGSYAVPGLPATAAGYVLCFDPVNATGGPASRYVAQCYKNITWTGGDLPAGTTAVVPPAGATTAGIDAALIGSG